MAGRRIHDNEKFATGVAIGRLPLHTPSPSSPNLLLHMSAISIPPDINRKHLEMARQQIVKGDLQKAAQTLNKAHRQMPNDARVFMLAALMAEKSGNQAKAEEAFARCVELAPVWGPGLMEYALYRARHNQFEPAIELAEKVARIEPHNPKVLAGVIDIAHRAGNLEMAVRHLRRGLDLYPGDAMLRQHLANDLGTLGEPAQARAILDSLVQDHPNEPSYRLARIKLQLLQGETATALEDVLILEDKYPDNPLLAYYASLARSATPLQQPLELHQRMFDGIAESFDNHLVLKLDYQLPKIVADQLLQSHPEKDFNLLDLGCGTGLLGLHLGPMKGYLIGVDSSAGMLEQAVKHGVYDRFHNVNLLDALNDTPADQYDVLTCLDVLIYVGSLQQVIPNAARILKTGGQFIFSCETAPEDGPDMVLQASHRYAHKRSYVEALCQQSGFSISTKELVLRQEAGEPVQGFVVTATKTAA